MESEERYWEIGKCPICGEELEKKEYKESRGEYWGIPSYENMNKFYCQCCGFIEGE